jgi:hypothetical protein
MRSEVKTFLFYFSKFLKPYKLVKKSLKIPKRKQKPKTSKSQKNKTNGQNKKEKQ